MIFVGQTSAEPGVVLVNFKWVNLWPLNGQFFRWSALFLSVLTSDPDLCLTAPYLFMLVDNKTNLYVVLDGVSSLHIYFSSGFV